MHTSPETHVFPGVAPRDRDRSLRLLDGVQRDWDTRGIGYWTVVSAASGDVLGFGGLRECVDDAEEVLNLYFRFLPDAWGRGYAPEMGHAALRWAHHNRPRLPVVIATSVRNTPAIRVADKLGFERVRERLHDGEPEVLYRWSVPEPLT
ncbi:Acetyltransferase (GNAT) domain-containing protein [Saccharopolyspora flava]|uniref:Acetyltransferase (GNAT) domain-containing protein n=1 Tax=Saccharopolyspora flava TaxID=95161 RepID=A0A1I6PDZ2_9PSEU|nr:Acetyltransferase (GNAT) domain-containing protein [Saccharopolyspora flava]